MCPIGRPHHDANVRFCAASARSSLLGGARNGGAGGSCQRSPPRSVIAAAARQCKQPLAGCTASGDAEGQVFAASRWAMALRGQLRGDAEAGRRQKCWRGEHWAVNRSGATNVFSS
jgi:hypothetical protein